MIGETFYYFSANKRVYNRDENGKATGGPIYSEHFIPIKVTGETSRSWLAGNDLAPHKIPKKGYGKYYTYDSMMKKIWDHHHRLRILDKVRFCSTAELRQIADVLGMVFKEEDE